MHLHVQSISLNPTSVNLSLNGHQVVTALPPCYNLVDRLTGAKLNKVLQWNPT